MFGRRKKEANTELQDGYATQEQRIDDLYEKDANEVLSYQPGVITRWGITIIFFVVGILIFVSWLIKYPDIIAARITILTKTPPAIIVTQTPGKITKLFVEEGQFCKRKTPLALIENTAKLEHVYKIKKELKEVFSFVMGRKSSTKTTFSHNLELGELQIDYHDFLEHYSNYLAFKNNDPFASKIQAFEQQIVYYKNVKEKQKKLIIILEEQLKLSKEKYQKLLDLFNDQSVSEGELIDHRTINLRNEHELEKAQINVVSSDIVVTEYKKKIVDLKQEHNEKKRVLTFLLRESYKKLQSKIATWEQKYILRAPIDGKVSLFKFWSPYQVVNTGDEVMTIIPKSYKIIGRVLLPQLRSGKVKKGQRVHIKLDSYPFHEYGFLIGEIVSISSISRESKYLLEISFPEGFTTSYNQKIKFKQEMQGNAEIITENLRLMDRIFYQIRNVIKTAIE